MVCKGQFGKKIAGAALSAAIAMTAIPVCGMTSLACENGNGYRTAVSARRRSVQKKRRSQFPTGNRPHIPGRPQGPIIERVPNPFTEGTEAEIDAQLAQLGAQNTYSNVEALAALNNLINTGLDVINNNSDVSEEDREAVMQAVTCALNTLNKPIVSLNEINLAYDNLSGVIDEVMASTYDVAPDYGMTEEEAEPVYDNMEDLYALDSLIKAGMDVINTNYDISDAERDAIIEGIAGALNVLNKSDASEDEINAAYISLSDAIDAATAVVTTDTVETQVDVQNVYDNTDDLLDLKDLIAIGMDVLDNDDLPDAESDLLLARLVGAFDVYDNNDATEDEIILAYCNLSDAIDSAIAAMDAADDCETPAIDLVDVPEMIIPDRGPTLPEERVPQIYGETPDDVDVTDVEHIDLIIQDRCPTLPEERVPQIYGETSDDVDVTDVEHVDLIIPDRGPTLPEERVPQIYGETPADMDVTDSEHIDLLVPDRYPTLDSSDETEQTSDFEISEGDSFTIEAQEETEIVPETVDQIEITAAENPDETPAAEAETTVAVEESSEVTPAPEAESADSVIPGNIVVNADQVEIMIVNGSNYEIETSSSDEAEASVETAAPAASVEAPAVSAPVVSAPASSSPAASAPAATVVTAAATDRASMVEMLVERFYRDALNRGYDIGGKAYWVDLLMNGNGDFNTVVSGFLNSAEFMDRNLTNEDFVTTLYKVFFNRVPSNSEKSYWMNKLNNGMTRSELINAFINSAEWEAMCESVGIV